MVDRFDMIVKNEECLSCHIVIMGNCLHGNYEEKCLYLHGNFMEVDLYSEPTSHGHHESAVLQHRSLCT